MFFEFKGAKTSVLNLLNLGSGWFVVFPDIYNSISILTQPIAILTFLFARRTKYQKNKNDEKASYHFDEILVAFLMKRYRATALLFEFLFFLCRRGMIVPAVSKAIVPFATVFFFGTAN